MKNNKLLHLVVISSLIIFTAIGLQNCSNLNKRSTFATSIKGEKYQIPLAKGIFSFVAFVNVTDSLDLNKRAQSFAILNQVKSMIAQYANDKSVGLFIVDLSHELVGEKTSHEELINLSYDIGQSYNPIVLQGNEDDLKEFYKIRKPGTLLLVDESGIEIKRWESKFNPASLGIKIESLLEMELHFCGHD